MKMDWLQKLKIALLAFSARLKLRKSLGGVRGECGGVGGLGKLEDDVQMCGYEDVKIMWDMLSKAQEEEMMMMATKTTHPPTPKNNKPFWSVKTLFLTSCHAKTPVLLTFEAKY